MTRALARVLTLALAAGATSSALRAQEPGDDVRLFAIPETRDARAVMQNARDHLRAQRYSEAITSLQRLIESHEGDVLPGRMEDSRGQISLLPFHAGAAAWANDELRSLPREARDLYRERYEKAAELALASARASGDRRALVEVGLRWPLTRAAARGWWTLGDLEMELGNIGDAQGAWLRATEIAALFGTEPSEGAKRRIDAAEFLLDASALANEPPAELRTTGPGKGGGPVPEDFADAWTQSLPKSPYRDHHSLHNIFPILAGEDVIVSTAWQVLSFDAYTGARRWESREIPGWTGNKPGDLSKGIDHAATLVAPAVSGSVVVAPMQVPHSRLGYTDYQGIRITVPIPERRLFAFDRETGDLLWDHSPSPLWDGESGSFAERMILAGPPVVSGSRVIVPCYLMQGRVDFHVACYDLFSGVLLWSTQLVSGQRPLNMFGRHEREFCAPPVRIESDRAIVLTQLGIVASLDVYTGRIQWQSRYEQIPLPATRGWRTQARKQHWRNASPVVVDGAVIATPVDSRFLFGLDEREGTVLWQLDHSSLRHHGGTADVDTLIGADEDVLYFGGARIAAFHAPAGFRRRLDGPRFSQMWSFHIDGYDMQRSPRAVVARDHIVVSTRTGRVVLDKRTGLERRRSSLPWIRERADRVAVGNLLVGNGMLFTANASEISGLFDWSILEARALERIEADPADVSALLTLAQVREQHGALLYQSGDVRGALDRLREARRLLEPRLSEPAHREMVAERLHRVLRTSARAREGLADVAGALDLLEQALPLAPTSDDLRDTLLEREAIVRDRDREAWLATMDELERRCPLKTMPREAWDEAVHDGGDAPAASIDPEVLDEDLPVGLWVLLMRARAHEQWGDIEGELEDLHACLSRYGTRRLAPGRTTFDLASARIGEAIERGGARAYDTFERRATEMVEGALEAGSVRELEAVRRLYPHSDAARLASDHLLDQAFAEGDAERVTRLVRESLSQSPELSPADGRRLSLLAELLGREGNRALLRGLYEAVTAAHPDLEVTVGGRTFAVSERLAELPAPPDPVLPSDGSTFDGSLLPKATVDRRDSSAYFELGYVPPGPAESETPPNPRLALLREVRDNVILEIHEAHDPVHPVIAETLPRGMRDAQDFRFVVTSERIVIADEGDVVALDARTGKLAWPLWSARRGYEVEELAASGGVLVVLLSTGEGDYQAVAFDANRGRELWRLYLPRGSVWRAPLCDANLAVFPTQTHTWQLPATALVVDLHRGQVLGEIELGGPLPPDAYEASFAQDGVLVVPSFRMSTVPERNHVVGYDLSRFEQAWRYEFEGGRELAALFRAAEETYLVVTPGDDGRGGAILQLQTRLGATRLVEELELDDRVLGTTRHPLARRGPIELDAPFLFYYTMVPGEATTRLTAVHLPYGKRWSCRLRVPNDELHDVGIALPAVSSRTVAIATTKRGANRMPGDTFLTLIDRNSGMKRGGWVLAGDLGRAADLRLLGLGEALFLLNRDIGSGFPREIWENGK